MSNEADDNDQPEADQATPGEVAEDEPRRRTKLLGRSRDREDDRDGDDEESISERLTQQFAHQWALLRADRRSEPAPIEAGPSNFNRAQVPWALDLAAAWAWRFLIISAAGLAVLWVLAYFAVITLPLVIALLIAALAAPVVRGLAKVGVPRALGAGLVVIGGIASVGALLTFVSREVIRGGTQLADQVVVGIEKIRNWLQDGPLHASDSQINGWLEEVQKSIAERSKDTEVLAHVSEFGTALGHVLAGFFIVLFATFFFLADGDRIWSWVVRMFPRASRERVDSSGRVAWVSLTQFVRATVVVALVDAIGIMIVAAILDLPLVLPIGVLVFLGAFVPMIGATIAGSVAVLVALVAQGPFTALIMLGGVILVQQIEGHILQPFLMGRFVSVHPLGVIIAIGCGVIVAGVAGALVAVPLAAVINAVVQHLASFTEVGEDPVEVLDTELEAAGREPGTSRDGAALADGADK
ncbi:AI-2E family transporter [Nocardioides jensenii]|uniref:AI-2E family transporter n=1 Tax=Nocardioides jensenii TaxID=1843 RepID=UPI000AD293D4|nr:AI-2E family transporter [Nocardioides jensenii]